MGEVFSLGFINKLKMHPTGVVSAFKKGDGNIKIWQFKHEKVAFDKSENWHLNCQNLLMKWTPDYQDFSMLYYVFLPWLELN